MRRSCVEQADECRWKSREICSPRTADRPVLVHPLVGRQVAPTQVPELSLFYSLPSCTTHRHRTTFVPGHLAYILFVTGSFKAKRRESSTHIASHPRARRRLRVGEAVRTKSGCRMSFLTKNRRTSPQDAPEATQDKFPAAQLGLLGMVFPCHRH